MAPFGGATDTFDSPIDCGVLPNSLDQFPGDGFQNLIAKNFYCAVINLKGVVKRYLFLREAELLTSLSGFPHFFGQFDRFVIQPGDRYKPD
jgi:hypothetical protein